MRVCKICGEWKKRGRADRTGFTCSSCLAKRREKRIALGERRQRSADGTVRYPCGNVVQIPEDMVR